MASNACVYTNLTNREISGIRKSPFACGTAEEKKALVAEQRKEVIRLEQRFAEHPDGYEELSKARDEAKQLQIYKANAEMLLRTDTEEQRQTRERQQEK